MGKKSGEVRTVEKVTASLCCALLPRRRSDGHKGTFGKVAVVGGAVGYTGAPVYAGEAAVRTGSGLVFVLVPERVYPIVAARCGASMARPLPETYSAVRESLAGCNAVLLGPGLGNAREARELAVKLLEDLVCPVVLDADGINAAAAHIDVLRGRRAPTVVTPHAAEFVRLGGEPALGREAAAVRFAREMGCVTVLKGPGTVVAAPDGRVRKNTTGTDALAKGGTGDVLAGMVLSLIGQGADPFDAAALAVWLHGRSGELCQERLTAYGVTPEDVVRAIPAAIREILEA